MFEFYKGKNVLVTGHTGFKGGWLAFWLNKLGANVVGYALEPDEVSFFNTLKLNKICNSVIGDIRDYENLKKTFEKTKPQIVFHLAAQPLVRLSYDFPVLTYQTNVMGTLNVLEAARNCCSIKSFVNITTDKCYENRETNHGYTEDEPMGGYDMYSSSKGCVEIMSSSYRRSFLKDDYAMATARAGNVIGGGDWAKDRLVPDCIKSIVSNKTIMIRSPQATRPFQHVLEPLLGYLILGEKLYIEGQKYAQGYNFGPDEKSVLQVQDIAKKIIKHWGSGNMQINDTKGPHEANLLMLNPSKAKKELDWQCRLDIEDTVKMTVEWYKNFYSKADMNEYTLEQIKNYENSIVKILA